MTQTPRAKITDVTASADPTVNDDGTQALDVRSLWINESNGKVWFCVDNSTGAAVWKDVSTPGAGSHPVTVSASDPTVTDDSNAGFTIGDHWINTTTKRVFQATDVTVGAAVWERVDQPKVTITTVDPTASNDETQDYEQHSSWINTATLPPKIYSCLDASTGAAVWRRNNNVKNNVSASTPNINDDNTQSYEVGSLWFDTSDNEVYVATSVVTGAARWKLSTVSGGGSLNNPGEFMFGTLLDYPSPGNVSSGVVFFLRLKFPAGVVLSDMRTFIDSGGSAARSIRMGIYAQTTPSDKNGVPNTRVAQTAATVTTGQSGLFMTVPLIGGDYTVPATGFYWLAVVSDSTSLKFAVTAASRANFLPIRQESGTGTTLPATTGTLTNPISSVLYIAAVEA